MRFVVTADEMRLIDRRTIDEVGMPGLILMENAGLGVAEVVLEALCDCDGDRVTIFCGRGNNGGDGMVAARHLVNRGAQVRIVLVGERKLLKGDALENLKMLDGFGLPVLELTDKRELKKVVPGDVIIDALLGTGISGQVTGLTADVIRWINTADARVVSVDLPSGLHSDDGWFESACVKADQTATMACLKRGLLIPPGREQAGQVTVVDIGSPGFVTRNAGIQTFYLEAVDAESRLPERPPAGHKGDFGKVFLLAGSPGLTGAAALSARASLAAGCGLSVLGVPCGLNPILEEKLTEVMTRPLLQTDRGTLSLKSKKDIQSFLSWADVLAVGPGLSTDLETGRLIREIVVETRLPVVVDADGLNAFEGFTDLLKDKKGAFILTPHFGELARLIGRPIEDIERNRIDISREVAGQLGCVLILKGAPTVVANQNGDVFINPTGNSGMATAGTGDVLTGMVAGFLAQGCSAIDAALCGVFYHGKAGDLGIAEKGERCLVAGDLIRYLPAAFSGNASCV